MSDQDTIDIDGDLADLPPAAKLCFVLLHDEGPYTAPELVNRTEMSKSTVHRAITLLQSVDAVVGDEPVSPSGTTVWRVP